VWSELTETIVPTSFNQKKVVMKKIVVALSAVLPVVLSSCSTPKPPQAYHNTDSSALVVESIDAKSCEVVAPTAIQREENARLLDQAKTFSQHQTAVIILENYNEPQLGPEFRDRTLDWFIGLRGLGYQHIVFLKGNGVTDPNGLPTLAEYD
jgi:hypothetical protein